MTTPEMPRLSAAEQRILEILVRDGESYGLALVRASDGDLKRGGIYVQLDRLENKGFVESTPESQTTELDRPARRLYRATGLGVRVLSAYEVLAGAWQAT